MSNTIRGGRSIDLNVQAGESLKVSTLTGTYTATVLAGAGAGTALATESSGGATYGPYAAGVVIRVKCSADGLADIDVGTAPALGYYPNALFATNDSGDITGLVDGAGNTVVERVPLVATRSWVGTEVDQIIDFGFEPDLVIVKGGGHNAVSYTRDQWNGGFLGFGNRALSGYADETPPTLLTRGIKVGNTQLDVNKIGDTYYAVGIKDNGSGILRTFSYNGYRNQTRVANGVNSDPVTMDLIAGTNPSILHIKRDSTLREGVWAAPGWAKKEDASALDPTLLTMSASGSLALSTDTSVNENDAEIIGEAHGCFALYNPGRFWSLVRYTGNADAYDLPAMGEVAAVIIIPQAAKTVQFWIDGMGANSADGANIAYATGRITAGSHFVTLGSDASVNASGVEYVAIIITKSEATEIKRPTLRRSAGVRISAVNNGVINCGKSETLAIAGAHSLEWIGSVTDFASEQVLLGRGGGTGSGFGSRATPTAGSWNYGMSYSRGPEAGLEICTSDRFSAQATNASKQQRWRTGYIFRPLEVYHVLYTHDGVDKWILYVNGVPVKWRRLSMSVVGLPGITASPGLNFAFGARNTNDLFYGSHYTSHFFGRLYRRELSQSEAAQMFKRNFSGQAVGDLTDASTALVEEWKFNEGSGSTVRATVNPANNGTIVGGSFLTL